MFRLTLSNLSIVLFLFVLSCRSDARSIEPSGEDINTMSGVVASDNVPAISDLYPETQDIAASKDTEEVLKQSQDVSKPISASNVEEEELLEDEERTEIKETQKPSQVTAPQIEPSNLVEITVPEEQSTQEVNTIEDKDLEVVSTEEVKRDDDESLGIPADIHNAWDELLKKFVSVSGYVDYKGFKTELASLDSYLKNLSANKPKDGDVSDGAMAYYINLYNAATVKLILDHYPVSSIKEINGGKPWTKEWIDLGGKKYSLNNIEHDILRPQFKDERVHFAVNCASESCPKIANKAFTATNLEAMLVELTKGFLNDKKLNVIKADAAQLSKLFQWYQGDFDNVVDFVNQYSDVKLNDTAKITYKDYLWNLNGK